MLFQSLLKRAMLSSWDACLLFQAAFILPDGGQCHLPEFLVLLITFFFLAQLYTAVCSPLLEHLLHGPATSSICVHLPVECMCAQVGVYTHTLC